MRPEVKTLLNDASIVWTLIGDLAGVGKRVVLEQVPRKRGGAA